MLVPDFVRQCVLFLGIKDAETSRFIPKGTAFVVSMRLRADARMQSGNPAAAPSCQQMTKATSG